MKRMFFPAGVGQRPPETVMRPVAAQPTLPLGEYVSERSGEVFLLADTRFPNSWHAYNALTAWSADSGFSVLKQYGPEQLTYAGFATIAIPDGATGSQLAAAAAPFLAPNRLVVMLCMSNVQGFLSDGWAAYHTWDGEGRAWAIVPDWPTTGVWRGSQIWDPPLGQPDSMLVALTHEVNEWLTDPDGRGYVEQDGDYTTEVGDLCNWKTYTLTAPGYPGGPDSLTYRVSQTWDARTGSCRP